MDSDTVACVDLVKKNEHAEIFEYPDHARGKLERRKTTIFAFETAPERRKAAR